MQAKLADCKVHADKRDEAIQILQQIVGFDPEKKTFDASKAKAPNEVEAYVVLASAYMKKPEDPATADLVMNRMIEVNKDSAEAYFQRASYLYCTWRRSG